MEADGKAAYAQLIERAWREPAFKQRLMAEPEAVFAEAGLPVPPDKKIKVVEETNTLGYFVLPPPPGGGGLSDVELDAVAGGGAQPFTIILIVKTPVFVRGLFTCK